MSVVKLADWLLSKQVVQIGHGSKVPVAETVKDTSAQQPMYLAIESYTHALSLSQYNDEAGEQG